MKLTRKHIKAMEAVKDGADVWAFDIARLLREVQRGAPEYIDICAAMEKPSGELRQPYFGAILTKAGVAALKAHSK